LTPYENFGEGIDFEKAVFSYFYDRIDWQREKMSVKLILRDKEFEVRPGMTLLSALEKCDILPESVIVTREGELILEDEILRDGDVIKLVAVISGGCV